MTMFTVRIELHEVYSHKPGQREYTKLHEEMEKHGFSRTILGESGRTFQMPSAEYHLIGDYTLTDIRDRVVIIAQNVWASVCVLVTEGSCAWYLKLV